MIDFGFIGGSVLAFWLAWNYWSIVPIVIIMIMGAIAWKLATTPKETQEREAWEQARENDRLSMSRPKRYGRIAVLISLSFMASTFFCVAIFKMFS